MINYRSLKKLLGETSLERKCRLLLGGALMILITISFSIYAARTRHLVENQQVVRAKTLVPGILEQFHLRRFASRADESTSVDPQAAKLHAKWVQFTEKLSLVNEFRSEAEWSIVLADEPPGDEEQFAMLEKLKNSSLESDHSFSDRGDIHYVNYFRKLTATPACLNCHDGKTASAYQPDAFVGMAIVSLPMDVVEAELSRNRAILFASAIVTSFLGMLVAYIIVRYIIVKPVQHLKDVSDEIARGNLNHRADISTGDEFEELSQAFNRMLRHMTTVNEEQRSTNATLDRKVDELAQTALQLFNTNAMKDEFLATMSHELRTPLNSILGFSDLLANARSLDERQKRYVENIRKSGRNLMVQINDLLDLAKIESGKMSIEASDIDVGDLIDAEVNQIRPLADQRNIDLRIHPPDEPMPQVLQDAGKIKQILTNLLSNAIKFTPEGGRVRVSYGLIENSQFVLRVEDTGIGIPMHEQEQIFEKFRQGSTTSGERDHVKREYGGTGLGLSIVRELSRLLGGDVELESEFGKGSMFSVTLPCEAPTEKPKDDSSLETSPGTLNRITSVDLLNRDTDNPTSAATPTESSAPNEPADQS